MNILRTKGENWRMATLNKWIVIAAALIIGLFAGMAINEAFDVFGSLGFNSRLKRMEREYDGLIDGAKARDRLLTERHRLDRERVEQDRIELENALGAERDRAERAEEMVRRQNELLEGTIEATGRGKARVREGIQSTERLRGIARRLEEQARRDCTDP